MEAAILHIECRNALLKALPEAARVRLLDRAHRVELSLRQATLKTDVMVDAVHFVEVGTVSMVAALADGARIEVGLVGPEGMVGLPLFLGNPLSQLEGVVQLAGSAWRLTAAAFKATLADTPELAVLLLRYTDLFHAQVVQTAVCNGRHQIDQRLARWLLMTHDRAGQDSFVVTQEFMSGMLGVRRPGVTAAIGALRRAGLVELTRGNVRVLDRPGLERAACECYEIVVRRASRMNMVT